MHLLVERAINDQELDAQQSKEDKLTNRTIRFIAVGKVEIEPNEDGPDD